MLGVPRADAEYQLADAVPCQAVLMTERRRKETDRHEVGEREQGTHRDADRRLQHDLEGELASSRRNVEDAAGEHVAHVRLQILETGRHVAVGQPEQ